MMLSSVRSAARRPLATRVAKRAFSDVTSTSIILSRHPAVDSIVAYRTTKGEESILALVALAQSRDIPLPNRKAVGLELPRSLAALSLA